MALVTLVYANIASLCAISWQLLKKRFTIIFPQIKRFENSFEKKFPDLKIVPSFWLKNPLFFPYFPDWKKSSKFSLISLIGRDPAMSLKFKMQR